MTTTTIAMAMAIPSCGMPPRTASAAATHSITAKKWVIWRSRISTGEGGRGAGSVFGPCTVSRRRASAVLNPGVAAGPERTRPTGLLVMSPLLLGATATVCCDVPAHVGPRGRPSGTAVGTADRLVPAGPGSAAGALRDVDGTERSGGPVRAGPALHSRGSPTRQPFLISILVGSV